MIGYPDWRHMWDESGPWRPTVDDVATLLAEIDRLTEAIDTTSEAPAMVEHRHVWVDHLHTCSCEKRGYDAALRALGRTSEVYR